jgi:hypothetical protein
MNQTGQEFRQHVERPVGSIAYAAFGGRGILIISLNIFVVVNSIDEYFYRFGVALHLDEPRIFDFTKMIVIGDQEFIGEELRRAVQKMIDPFRAFSPFSLHCGYEDGVIKQIS